VLKRINASPSCGNRFNDLHINGITLIFTVALMADDFKKCKTLIYSFKTDKTQLKLSLCTKNIPIFIILHLGATLLNLETYGRTGPGSIP